MTLVQTYKLHREKRQCRILYFSHKRNLVTHVLEYLLIRITKSITWSKSKKGSFKGSQSHSGSSCTCVPPSVLAVFLPDKPFNPDVQQLVTHTAEITLGFCPDLSLITAAVNPPNPGSPPQLPRIPCGGSHLSPASPGIPTPHSRLFVPLQD